ncbi:MAG TPA: efflux RND transporter permease subunit, partial [Kineobactrum sp.]
HHIGLLQLAEAIAAASLRLPAEPLRGDRTRRVQVGSLPATVADVEQSQVGAGPAGLVYLRDVAAVVDGPAPVESASLHWQRGSEGEVAAISLALTSVPNANISAVTERALKRLDELAVTLLPSTVQLTIAHDAGAMATETVVSVLENFATATVTVVAIILIGLGWRAAVGVSLQLPSSLAIVPAAYLWLGYTLNPVSIAAMILAIGLLADDNVIIMENIRRHFRRAGNSSRNVAVKAVDEVGNPTIIAVFLIIVTFLPTAFITGEMGQYTRAIPIGTSLAIAFSLVIALTVTPYVAYRILGSSSSAGQETRDTNSDESEIPHSRLADTYRRVLQRFFDSASLRWLLYLVLSALLVASIAMVGLRAVQLTLVPILDRDVFVVELELPPPGPPDIPVASSHRASLYVQLPPAEKRERMSFEISRDLAFEQLPALLEPFGGRAWVRSIPSGPSSDNDIQAEIVGEDIQQRDGLAEVITQLFEQHKAIGAIEHFPKPTGPELRLDVNLNRAAVHGVAPARIVAAVQLALTGRTV